MGKGSGRPGGEPGRAVERLGGQWGERKG
jgi:hypothetical protein